MPGPQKMKAVSGKPVIYIHESREDRGLVSLVIVRDVSRKVETGPGSEKVEFFGNERPGKLKIPFFKRIEGVGFEYPFFLESRSDV